MGAYKSRAGYRESERDSFEFSNALQWVGVITAEILLFGATLHAIHVIFPLSGLASSLLEFFQSSLSAFSSLIGGTANSTSPQNEAILVLLMLGLIGSTSGTARDWRVHLVSLGLALSTIAIVWFYRADFETLVSQSLSTVNTGIWRYILTFVLTVFVMVAITASFRQSPVSHRRSRRASRRREQFLMLYWVMVICLCLFQFFFLMTNPFAQEQAAGDAILTIAFSAILLLLLLYLSTSVILFAQIIIWNGVVWIVSDTKPMFAEFAQQPFPQIVDPLQFPAASASVIGLLGIAWISYSICAFCGAIKNVKFLYLHALSMGAAVLVALVSTFI